ncbi:hypothetical protein [Bordetella bronchiseptica]|uniref:hypothetical protein n=1 Tax=Bordetella bronchiseptica TaxID=518 RepID=UPI00403D3606
MQENRDISFIKPCRSLDEEHRTLSPEYAASLQRMGRVVQINIDNCSLQRMEQLPLEPTLEDAEKVGLLPLVQILTKAPFVALSAIGLNEMPDCRVEGAKLAYERFCAVFWSGHKNDIHATHRTYDTESTVRKIEFSELGDGARCTYGIAYVALLQIQNINRTFPSFSPEEKFETYLHSIIYMLDIVSAFELEIAKYAFWDLSVREINALPDCVHLRRKDIKENFTKLQSSVNKCKQFAFNGAMDLHWLSGANLSEDLGETLTVGSNKFAVDHWVGTNDIKLYRISKDIHSVPNDHSKMMALAYSRESVLQSSPYWKAIDRYASNVLLHRREMGYGKVDELLKKIDEAVSHLEEQLRSVLPE